MKTFIKITLPFVAIVTLSSCGNETAKKEYTKEMVYETVTAEEGQPTTKISLPGELMGFYETDIYPKVNSYVKTLFVDIGDKVPKGQLLAELEAPELSSKLNEGYSKYKAAESIFLNTKGKYNRLLQTSKTSGAVSPYDMDLSKTNVTSDSLGFIAAEANYHSLQELVSYLKITAPFDGIITERNISPGAFVGPSEKNAQAMLIIKNESKLRLRISVPEKHVSEIKKEQEISFTVSGYPEKTFSGKVTRNSSNINTQLRSEVIEIEIENKTGILLPGMFAKVDLPLTRNEKTIIVPESAVATNMEHCFVIKLIGKKAKMIDVQKGNVSDGKVEIFGDVKVGDVILKEANDEIKDGTVINSNI
ncbi:MAG: efflux RND transporter periplasmic adaptor subunit [Bacteroidia bacterium]